MLHILCIHLYISDISRRIFIPLYQYGCPNSGAQKRKYTFIYADIALFNL